MYTFRNHIRETSYRYDALEAQRVKATKKVKKQAIGGSVSEAEFEAFFSNNK